MLGITDDMINKVNLLFTELQSLEERLVSEMAMTTPWGQVPSSRQGKDIRAIPSPVFKVREGFLEEVTSELEQAAQNLSMTGSFTPWGPQVGCV